MTKHKLPRTPLYPRFITMPLRHASYRHAAVMAAMRSPASAARLDVERPWRIINQRRRLAACHWAGWRPERTSMRWGDVGPRWLVRWEAL